MEFNYEHDSENYRSKLLAFPSQVKEALSLGSSIVIEKDVSQIYVIGMGGSGLAGRLLEDYLGKVAPQIHVKRIQSHIVPTKIDPNALVFVASYSGNTEETLAAYRQIARSGAKCIVISSGGKMAQIAPMFLSEFIQIPQINLPPRLATAYMFVPMLVVLMKNGVIPNTGYLLDSVSDSLSKDIYETYAKTLVEQIGVKTPIIYTDETQGSVGYKWKSALNESAKTFAFANVFPECTHNELEAFAGSSDSLDEYMAVILKDIKGDARVQSMMDQYKTMIRKNGGHAIEVVIRSPDPLGYLLTTTYLGDWVAYYMALAKGVDPTPTQNIEVFKKKA